MEFLKMVNFEVSSVMKNKKKDVLLEYLEQSDRLIKLEDFAEFCRSKWLEPNIGLHIKNLKSGVLKGHGWCGAMPSTLHLSIQNKVREVCSGRISLSEFLEMGNNIIKHEYFIVAIADLCEWVLIKKLGAIPSIINRGVSDFAFKGIPYDLKNTSLPNGWSFGNAIKNPEKVAFSLFTGADILRMRKQATHPWAYNRFYVVTRTEDIWIEDPEGAMKELEASSRILEDPIKLSVDGKEVLCQVVFIDA